MLQFNLIFKVASNYAYVNGKKRYSYVSYYFLLNIETNNNKKNVLTVIFNLLIYIQLTLYKDENCEKNGFSC